jgi:hypothetical protein
VKPVITKPIAKITAIVRMMSGLRFIARSSDAPEAKFDWNQKDIADFDNQQ